VKPILHIVIALLILASTNYLPAEPWKAYVNEGFGFRLTYPESLKSSRQPGNGAGLNFTDGAFSVTAQEHFLNGKKLEDFYRDALESYGSDITYKVKKQSWFVVSGDQSNGYVVYKKFHVQDGNWAEFTATYPIGTGAKYDPVIERMAKEFVPFLVGDGYDRARQ
jgi:hypothetical protein